MTPEEAIKIIKSERDGIPSDIDADETIEAFTMGIEALKNISKPAGERIKAEDFIKAFSGDKENKSWIFVKTPFSDEKIIKCPFCKEEFIGKDVEDYNYCPICGKRLKGRTEDQPRVATSRIEQETEIERDITRLESRMARIEEIFVVLSKGLNIGTKAQHGWGLDPDDEKFLIRSWVELYKELYGAPEETENK